MNKKLKVEVANPKSDEHYSEKIKTINAIFKSIYKVPKKS